MGGPTSDLNLYSHVLPLNKWLNAKIDSLKASSRSITFCVRFGTAVARRTNEGSMPFR